MRIGEADRREDAGSHLIQSDIARVAPSAWWRPWRVCVAVILAVGVGGFAFLYRFNALGGTFAGFENDHFAHLMRTEFLFRGEQPLRDFADAELRGAWPALSYLVPFWAQRIGGRTLLSDAYLTIGALALAYAIVFVVALDLSKRWSVGILAALASAAALPKLYNYPKVLVFTLGGAALCGAMRNPSVPRLLTLAAVTAIAVLFRHDYGVYIAAGAVVGLAVRSAGRWRIAVRHCTIYVGLTALLLLPSALWVQRYEGIASYLSRGFASSRVEAQRTWLDLPPFDPAAPFTDGSLIYLTYWTFWAAVIAALAVLGWRMTRQGAISPTRAEIATGASLLAVAMMANLFLLRSNLTQRFGDAIVPLTLVVAWSVGGMSTVTGAGWRTLGTFSSIAVLAFLLVTAFVYGNVLREFDATGFGVSWNQTAQRFAAVRADLLSLPPQRWSDVTAEGPLIAARYVAECTRPDDYLFVVGYAPELPVLARRRFAAGQSITSLSYYTSESDQRRALERLNRQSVPIVLADAATFETEFADDYPLLATFVADHYREAGRIDVADDRSYRVFVDASRKPERVDPYLGLPCFA